MSPAEIPVSVGRIQFSASATARRPPWPDSALRVFLDKTVKMKHPILLVAMLTILAGASTAQVTPDSPNISQPKTH